MPVDHSVGRVFASKPEVEKARDNKSREVGWSRSRKAIDKRHGRFWKLIPKISRAIGGGSYEFRLTLRVTIRRREFLTGW